MKNKKGIVEAQLTWVFILMVGAVILLFFFGIAQKQKQIADMKTSSYLLQQLDGILTGAEVSSGTNFLIKIPNIQIRLEDCNSFSVGGLTKSLKSRVVFSPDLIKGRQLITYNLDWSIPYRVTNFLYLTSPEVRYVLVDPPADFYDELPEIMNKEIYKEPLKDKNNYKIKFIFFNKDPNDSYLSNLKNMPDKDVAAINILSDKIQFYKKNGEGFEKEGNPVSSPTNEQIIGAVFAEDKDQYDCAMAKADEKKKVVAEIYKKRISFLEKLYPETSSCSSLLQNIDFSSDIETQNYNLQMQGCPTIY